MKNDRSNLQRRFMADVRPGVVFPDDNPNERFTAKPGSESPHTANPPAWIREYSTPRSYTIAETIKAMVEIMVRIPQCVRVTPQISNDTVGRQVTCFDIDVHDSDRGRLIGRGGANMRALRVLLNSAAYVCGTRYRVTCSKGSKGARGAWKPADERYKFAHHGDP